MEHFIMAQPQISIPSVTLNSGHKIPALGYGTWLGYKEKVNLNLSQTEIINLCKLHNIKIIAHTPLGTMVPLRNTAGTPEPKLNNLVLMKIAEKYGKSVVQVTLRYLHQRGLIPIPKTISKSRVVENADIFGFELNSSECDTLAQFDNGFRTVRPLFWQDYEYYPFEQVSCEKLEIPLGRRKWKNGINENIDYLSSIKNCVLLRNLLDLI